MAEENKTVMQPGSAYIKCPRCGHVNRPGTLLCDACGTNLVTGAASSSTRALPQNETRALEATAPPSTPGVSMGSTVFESQMMLAIQLHGSTAPILIKPSEHPEIMFGRADVSAGITPQIDLTPYAAFQLGISRRHASVVFRDRQLFIQDLGSSNGTYLNGVRLNRGELHQLRHGDEIKMGQMTMQFLFQMDGK